MRLVTLISDFYQKQVNRWNRIFREMKFLVYNPGLHIILNVRWKWDIEAGWYREFWTLEFSSRIWRTPTDFHDSGFLRSHRWMMFNVMRGKITDMENEHSTRIERPANPRWNSRQTAHTCTEHYWKSPLPNILVLIVIKPETVQVSRWFR